MENEIVFLRVSKFRLVRGSFENIFHGGNIQGFSETIDGQLNTELNMLYTRTSNQINQLVKTKITPNSKSEKQRPMKWKQNHSLRYETRADCTRILSWRLTKTRLVKINYGAEIFQTRLNVTYGAWNFEKQMISQAAGKVY